MDLDACILASVFEAFDLGFDFEVLYSLSGSSAKIDIDDPVRKIIKRNLWRVATAHFLAFGSNHAALSPVGSGIKKLIVRPPLD